MPKGPYLTPPIKKLIAEIYAADRTAGPTEVRRRLLEQMKERGLHEYFPPEYPSVSAVSKELKERRQIDDNRSPQSKALDGPWHLLTLATHDISPEAIPYIMRVQASRVEIGGPPVTIRQARWVAWLSRFVDNPRLKKRMGVKAVEMLLSTLSFTYAQTERIYELLGEAERLPDAETEKWLMLRHDLSNYQIVTEDVKPLLAAEKRLSEVNPEAYQFMMAEHEYESPGIERLEELIERLEKEVQNER